MPIFAKGSDGLEYQLLLRNVRHSPTFMDSLISINQLWQESKVDVIFKDSCCLRAPCGKQFPFGVPRATGLCIWNVISIISKRGTQERMAPTVSQQLHGRNYHNDPLSKPGANPLKTSDAKSRSKVLSFQATHSSKSISHIASLAPDIAAQHMHRRLHVGARRMNLLPSMTADAPSNLSRAKVGSCPHCVAANSTLHSHSSDRYVESRPGRLIHADIAGPFVKSAINHHEYLLVLVDDHSRFWHPLGVS